MNVNNNVANIVLKDKKSSIIKGPKPKHIISSN